MSVLDHFPIIEGICKHLQFQDLCKMPLVSKKCAKFFKSSERVKEIITTLISIRRDPYVIETIEQTRQNCIEAVTRSGYALQVIKNQTEEICLEAIRYNLNALMYVREDYMEWNLMRNYKKIKR